MIRLMLDPITRVTQLSSQQQNCDAENDWIKPFLTENDVIKRLGRIIRSSSAAGVSVLPSLLLMS